MSLLYTGIQSLSTVPNGCCFCRAFRLVSSKVSCIKCSGKTESKKVPAVAVAGRTVVGPVGSLKSSTIKTHSINVLLTRLSFSKIHKNLSTRCWETLKAPKGLYKAFPDWWMLKNHMNKCYILLLPMLLIWAT